MKKLFVILGMLCLLIPRDATAVTYVPMGEFMLTAYCDCEECSCGYGRHTASGAYAKEGRTIAVDPSVISYGATVSIDGEIYKAEDCGGAVVGDHIDIFMDDHSETEEFGVQYADVRIIRSE